MHIFISYAKVDTQPLALKIRDTLRLVNGLTAWMDESLESGEDWAVQIQDEIDRCDLMLVLLSPDVNRTSEPRSFVLREIHYAQDNHKPILPVMAQKTKIPVQLAGIQYEDLTQNQAASIEALIENVCRRFGLVSPAEQRRQAEEAERQRVAELHRQTVEAEQKRQAQIAAQRQAEEQEQRRKAQAQIEAQHRADEQARQQNAQTAPAMPVMQPRPNAPQDWNKQYSDGSSAAYQAKVSAAGPRKSAVGIPLLAGGAVIAALILVVIVGLLLSGVLGGDDKNNKNNDVRYQAIFDNDHTVTTSENDVCAFYVISVGDTTKNLEIKLESPNSALTKIGESPELSLQLYKNSESWGTRSTQATFLTSTHYNETLTAEVESGEYIVCLTATGGDYYTSYVKGDSFWVKINLKE